MVLECNDDIEQDDVDHANVVINIRELDDVLMKDVGLKIAQSGRYTHMHTHHSHIYYIK